MSAYFNFHPDLVVETTSVCDRQCSGCYAPNIVSAEDGARLYASKPGLFLLPSAFVAILQETFGNTKVPVVALRGGEPSRHPEISQLLIIAACFSKKVILETHGRWVLDASKASEDLLNTCAHNSVVIKISFDKMHGLSRDNLYKITERLDHHGIQYMVAITEDTEKDFHETRALCDWIANSQITFQRKAYRQDDLISPKIGVVRVNGALVDALSAKTSLKIQKSGDVA